MKSDSNRPHSIEKADDDEEEFFLDEGWWDSVLAEEGVNKPLREDTHKANAKPCDSVDWELVKGFHERDEIVSLRVHGFNRGGLLVIGDGVQGFVPISHLVNLSAECDGDHRDALLKGYVNKMLELKVIECNESQERVVLSERAALAGEGCRKRLFSELVEGDIVCGTVTNITDFGAFIDLGGVEGLIHVSELSWGRVRHPQEVLALGQKIEAQVLHISEKDERVALSYKRQFHNPWSDILDVFQPGMVTDAVITTITRYGAFARLKDGIEGLIHISSICSQKDRLQNDDSIIHEILETGQQVQVKILHMDIGRRRLGLELLDSE